MSPCSSVFSRKSRRYGNLKEWFWGLQESWNQSVYMSIGANELSFHRHGFDISSHISIIKSVDYSTKTCFALEVFLCEHYKSANDFFALKKGWSTLFPGCFIFPSSRSERGERKDERPLERGWTERDALYEKKTGHREKLEGKIPFSSFPEKSAKHNLLVR